MWNMRNLKKLCLATLLALCLLPKAVQAFALYPDYHNLRFAATNAANERVLQNAYDPAGNLTNRLDAAGNTIAYTYDALNRPIHRQYGHGMSCPSADAFAYDPAGNLLTASNAVAQESFTYDAMDRLATASTTLATSHWPLATYQSTYVYDAGGLVTNLVFGRAGSPSPPQVSRTYDSDGRLATVSDWLGHTWTFTWDGAGKPTGMIAPGGIVATNHYDAAGRLAAWQIGSLAGRAISRDAAGLKTREDITAGMLPTPQKVRYADNTFDAADRLTSAQVRYGSHTNAPIQETYLFTLYADATQRT